MGSSTSPTMIRERVSDGEATTASTRAAFRGTGTLTSQHEGIRQLRRRVAQFEEERAILKKQHAAPVLGSL